MRVRRLRSGEAAALAGAVALVVLLSLRWFDPQGARPAPHTSGWASLGWVLVLLLVLAVVGALALVVLTLAGAAAALPIATAVATVPVTVIGELVLLLRVAIFQPTLGAGLPSGEVAVQWPAYAGLAALALLGWGAWRAMSDERLDAPESAYEPPPARPAPRLESNR
jgi:hypothetical protein